MADRPDRYFQHSGGSRKTDGLPVIWGLSENKRKPRYYAITKAEQKQLARERQIWKSISTAVDKVLEGA